MPKLIKSAKSEEDFTKASVKIGTKEILKKIADNEGLYEYELIEKMLKSCYPNYFRGKKVTV